MGMFDWLIQDEIEITSVFNEETGRFEGDEEDDVELANTLYGLGWIDKNGEWIG